MNFYYMYNYTKKQFSTYNKNQSINNTDNRILYRQRLEIKGNLLTLENSNYRKSLSISISNTINNLSAVSKHVKYMKIINIANNKIFPTNLMKLNHIIFSFFIIFSTAKILFCFINKYNNNNNNYFNNQNNLLYNTKFDIGYPYIQALKKEFDNIEYYNNPNYILQVFLLFKMFKYVNFMMPKRTFFLFLFNILLINTLNNKSLFDKYVFNRFKDVEGIDNCYYFINKNDSEINEEISKFHMLLNKADIEAQIKLDSNYLKNKRKDLLYSLIQVDNPSIQYTKCIFALGLIGLLNSFVSDNSKYFNLSNIKIKYFNSKNIKIFTILFVVSKVCNSLNSFGLDVINISSLEGIIFSSITLASFKPSYILSFGMYFLFNPYSLLVFSNAKNSINEELIDYEYKKKDVLNKFLIRAKFMLLNLIAYSKDIYF